MVIQESRFEAEGFSVESYQIKQVSAMTGLSTQLIRKWEQRYNAVQPIRVANGYREYSAHDVARLREIKALVDQGTPVSRAVKRALQGAQPLATGAKPPRATMASPHEDVATSAADLRDFNSAQDVTEHLIAAGANGNVQEMERLLKIVAMQDGMSFVIRDVIIPLLRQVGDLWAEGSWSEDQEHLASLTVRNFVTQRMADMPAPSDDAPGLLGACLLGERHDIMLNIAMLEARRLGWKPLFLGPEPAPTAVENAFKRLSPKVVLLSVTTRLGADLEAVRVQWLAGIDRLAGSHRETEFFLGGPAHLVHDYTASCQHIQEAYDLPSFLSHL